MEETLESVLSGERCLFVGSIKLNGTDLASLATWVREEGHAWLWRWSVMDGENVWTEDVTIRQLQDVQKMSKQKIWSEILQNMRRCLQQMSRGEGELVDVRETALRLFWLGNSTSPVVLTESLHQRSAHRLEHVLQLSRDDERRFVLGTQGSRPTSAGGSGAASGTVGGSGRSGVKSKGDAVNSYGSQTQSQPSLDLSVPFGGDDLAPASSATSGSSSSHSPPKAPRANAAGLSSIGFVGGRPGGAPSRTAHQNPYIVGGPPRKRRRLPMMRAAQRTDYLRDEDDDADPDDDDF